MNIVVAMDSFKGSLSSVEAGQAVRAGIAQADPRVSVTVRPLADGGEGTVEALISGLGGQWQQVTVTGPLSAPVVCSYGILPDSGTAVVEMSGAAGLTLVPKSQRNPLYTTTYGVGEVIRDAIAKGCRRFLVGIGGSATNDGGVGMLQALGYGFFDAEGRPIPHGAQGLSHLARITCDGVLPQLAQAVCPDTAHPDAPGTGAAGGLGFAFQTFLRGVLEPGVSIVLEETHLEGFIRDADLVITGEGRLDGQTAMGKAPVGVAQLAKRYHKPVVALAGCVTPDATACHTQGIDAFFPILSGPCSLEQAMEPDTARANLAATAQQVFRLFQAGMTN